VRDPIRQRIGFFVSGYPDRMNVRRPPTTAAVIGSGPNGLAAAIELLRTGVRVRVHEANPRLGGACRSDALTLPGFVHDHCAAVMPGALASRFFRSFEPPGIEWIVPEIAVAHPFDDGTAAVLLRSVNATAGRLGADSDPYRSLFDPIAEGGLSLLDELLAPLHLPHQPWRMAMVARHGFFSARWVASRLFAGRDARALFAGNAAHSMLRLTDAGSAAAALVLMAMGHVGGWPAPRGGSGQVSTFLAGEIERLGGAIVTNQHVTSLDEFGDRDVVLFDTSPRALVEIAGSVLPERYRRQLRRYRYGPGVFKIDWALSGAIPWRAEECRQTATVHAGGTLEEIVRSEEDAASGRHSANPFVIVTQPSVLDPSRAPAGHQVGSAYCHVPSGSAVDMTDAIERQIERFAPGFRALVLARATTTAVDIQRGNANLIGGDIGAGSHDLRQLFFRPVPSLNPYRTPDRRLLLCSAATPPGAGVHGLGGYYAARAALGLPLFGPERG
jgi:phytoene dehydrogenase-like protein